MAKTMAKRKTTPDMLRAVLSDEDIPAEAEEQTAAEDKPTKAPEKKEPQGAQKSRPQRAAKKPAPQVATPKQYATFYISQDTIAELEEAWMSLRRIRKGKKGSVSKSTIVEVALRTALEDFRSDRKNSTLGRAVGGEE